MSSSDDPFGFEIKKKKIQEHYQKFNKLKNEGKWRESLIELQKTLEGITELMNHSAITLNYTMKQFSNLTPEQKEKIQKLLYSYLVKNFPEKNIILNSNKTYH